MKIFILISFVEYYANSTLVYDVAYYGKGSSLPRANSTSVLILAGEVHRWNSSPPELNT